MLSIFLTNLFMMQFLFCLGSPLTNQLYEGDIKYDLFRNAHGRKWPKSNDGLAKIPYILENSFNSRNRSLIREAFASFHKHTCIRFVPRTSEVQYLSIENHTSCWSYVGRTTRRKQALSLNIPQCMSKGYIMHELMHAVGFRHEHSRSDRDKYIYLVRENINNADIRYFRKILNTENLVVYDYTSIMHYTKNAFAKHSYLTTLETLPKRVLEPKIGFRRQLSAYDIEEMKYHYKCGPKTYERCGRDFVNQNRGVFNSPNYPRTYPSESHCTWNITVREGKLVKLVISNIKLESSSYCQLDSIIVHDGKNAGAPVLIRICGRKTRAEFLSSGNQMFVIFTSDPSSEFRGFRAGFLEVTSTKNSVSQDLTPAATSYVDEFKCNFDKDMCGMMPDITADTEFRLNHGPTPTNDTGPTSDHTTKQGNYIYLESSNAVYGSEGRILTPWMKSPGRLCLKFSYHMFGNEMGGLRVYALEKKLSEKHASKRFLWEKFGNQGKEWKTTNYLFSPYGRLEYVQFYWEGYLPHYSSDIAIDDIEITRGFCRYSYYSRRLRPFFYNFG